MCESTARIEIIRIIGELYRKSKRSRLYRLIDPHHEGRKFVNYAMDGIKMMNEHVDRKMWEVTEDLHRVRPEAGYHYYVMMR